MNWAALRRTAGPGAEPVTLAEAKTHLRVDVDDDDDLIEGLIQAAREHVESVIWRSLVSQDWALTLDAWPSGDRLELPRPPLQSVATITYVDEDGVSHTLAAADYLVDTAREPGRVVLKSGATWPSATLRPAAGIEVAYTAGYGDAGDDVPRAIRAALLLLVGHWYENREAVMEGARAGQETPLAVDMLLATYRVWGF